MKRNTLANGWDHADIANLIDEYWREDPSKYEYSHRRTLSKLVAHYLKAVPGKVMEIGCGSGYVYEQLVPSIIANSDYLGIDSSKQMLSLAQKYNPSGNFQLGDVFELAFSDNYIETVICFEVLSHLPEVVRPIAEAFRVCSTQLLFSLWISDNEESLFLHEHVGDTRFPHNCYTHKGMLKFIEQAIDLNLLADLEVRVLSSNMWVYCLRKGQNKGFVMTDTKIMSFPGLLEELTHQHRMERESLRSGLINLQKQCDELTVQRNELRAQYAESPTHRK